MATKITNKQVTDWISAPNTPEAHVTPVVAAVNAMVGDMPQKVTRDPDPAAPAEVGPQWADQTITAAVMLAARLVRRRNSPAGVEAFADAGAVYVARYDPDIARMLRLDGYAAPQIG